MSMYIPTHKLSNSFIIYFARSYKKDQEVAVKMRK